MRTQLDITKQGYGYEGYTIVSEADIIAGMKTKKVSAKGLLSVDAYGHETVLTDETTAADIRELAKGHFFIVDPD